ncbi:MAG: thiamine-phosphate kinase [Verrucomicrobiota bacterium]|nr:thiamine-phosphate kinase [Verrucomicrobiota bacterium]
MKTPATARQAGELALIQQLCRLLQPGRGVIRGPGDDCAVVRIPGSSSDWLLKSDSVIQGVHFPHNAPAGAVGCKAVGRVLSDIAAMGGRPHWALVNLVAPAGTRIDRLRRIYRGAAALALRHGLAIVGGDTSRGPVLELHVFAVGSAPRSRAVLRSGARPGNALFVTGRLGGSIRGKHLTFEPRVSEGQWLRDWATAMIDLSDGLATDLRRLVAQSRVGARLRAARIPIAPAARRLRDGRSPLHHALTDGEDFELLFAIPARRQRAFRAAWRRAFRLPCACIGEIIRRKDVIECVDAAGKQSVLKSSGYQHFHRR